MALTVGDRTIRPITANEAMEMVGAGIVGADERVELLHGVLTRVSPQHAPHATVVQRLTRWLAPLLVRGTHDVRVQLPLRVPDPTSLPEPDLAVVERDDTVIGHPTTAPLVIEVADSSLRVDMTVKPALYAAAGVPEYWIVDLSGRRVHILTRPTVGGYADEQLVADRARPGHVDPEPLELASLFAGL